MFAYGRGSIDPAPYTKGGRWQMADLRVITLSGAEAALGEAVVERFGSGLRGELLRHGDTAYEEARKIWNGLIDKRPALIARCAGVGDVVDSVNFARENGLLVAVRGGGHNVAGYAVCDGEIGRASWRGRV